LRRDRRGKQYDRGMNPLAGVLTEAWQMYKAHAWHLLAIAFVIYVAAAIIAGVLALAGTAGALLGSVVELFAAFLLQAALVKGGAGRAGRPRRPVHQ
jgi:hypothetical protein